MKVSGGTCTHILWQLMLAFSHSLSLSLLGAHKALTMVYACICTWISFFRLFILFFLFASSVCFLSSSCLGSSSSSSRFWSLSRSDLTRLLIPLTFWLELWAFSFKVAIFFSSFWRFSRRGWFFLCSSFSLREVFLRASFFLLHSSLAASYSYSRGRCMPWLETQSNSMLQALSQCTVIREYFALQIFRAINVRVTCI